MTAPPEPPRCAVCDAPLDADDTKIIWDDDRAFVVHLRWRDCFKCLTGMEWTETVYGLRGTTEPRERRP